MSYLKDELYQLVKQDSSIFNFVQDIALDGLWFWDLENQEHEWVSLKFWTILGYNPEELPSTASSWQNMIHHEDLETVLQHLQEISHKAETNFNLIVRYYHKNGSVKWLKMIGLIIKSDTGKAIRLIAAHVDITDLKVKEDLLVRCNVAASVGFWEINLSTMQPIWSHVTKIIHEVSDDYIPDIHSALDFYAVGNKELIENAVTKLLKTGTPYDLELQIITAKGNLKWVRAIGLSEFVNGICTRVYGTFQDINQSKVLEIALISEREKLENVILGTNAGTWEWNIQTGETIFNERWAEIVGYTLDELQPISIETWVNLSHPEDLKKSNEKINDCCNKITEYYHIECRMRHKNGHWVWILDRGKITSWTADGKPLMMFGTHTDITEQKLAFERNQQFVKQAPSAIAMFDTNLHYLAASNKWIDDYKLNGLDIIGKSHYEIFPEIGEDWKKIHQNCLQGVSQKCEEDKFLREDGTVQWIEWEIKPWFLDSKTQGGIIMYTDDITERKVTQEKLKISEQAFRGNFENAAIGMALLNKEANLIQANKRLCDIIGYTENELKKATFKNITHPDDRDLDTTLYHNLINGKINDYRLEKRYIHKNNSIVYVILAASVVRDDEGEILYFIFQVVDITALKNAEYEIQTLLEVTKDQNKRLKNFAHIVSHNLRSHTSNIEMLIYLLFQENPELESNNILQLIKTAADNLTETIAHLNEVVQMNSETLANLISLDLYAFTEHAISNLKVMAATANVKVQNHITAKILVKGISAYLDSILFNLINNAIKYSSTERESFVKIDCYEEDKYIVLTITDNGLGIDLKTQGSKLFGMYQTFHGNPDARGIGLFITKNQIETMGGKIEVLSEVNKGTTFKVYLLSAQK
ncbi:PAS domain-containing sensor histidine kinase [Pedobacter glucosidilyticus]|uniref:PAS domain-containing sensor histidine kinase n=1 Tax=Pedobacter glucosidilyticus TaxID=1122941 RepID=UPI0026EEC812|nr:PAS domain-containing protein [Pedobacter glucosidilyticus]